MTNPFVEAPLPEEEPEELGEDPILGEDLELSGLASVGRARDVEPAPPGPEPQTISHRTVLLYPASGGVGVSTLAKLAGDHVLDGGEYLLWEDAPTFVVASTHYAGLEAAAEVVRQAARGELPVRLRGLVLVHDRPSLPKETVRHARQVAGLYPRTITVPFIPEWRDAAPTGLADLPSRVRLGLATLSTQETKESSK